MGTIRCPVCGSNHVQNRGSRHGRKRYQCVDREHPEGPKRYFYEGEEGPVSSTVQEGDEFINVILSSPRILSEEDIINRFEIDTTKWRIKEFEVKTQEAPRKDHEVDLSFDEGKMTGMVRDSGKMLVVQLYHIRAKFVRKTEEIRATLVISDLIEDIKNHLPQVTQINYPTPYSEGMMYEIDMPDIHFGRLTWAAESGDDYDIKLAYQSVHCALDQLLSWIKGNPSVSQILLPLGNDFFNVNSKDNTTVHGTPQQEDTRWQKTFTSGRRLAQEIIAKCSLIAPVKVVIISGNHDEEKMFYLGEVLDAAYANDPNVGIDNTPKGRKYHLHGSNLVGFAHGYDEKLYKLPSLMALDEPELWGKSRYREFHTGDKHHKFDTSEDGVTVRILRALAAKDAWTFRNGFVGSIRAAESFLWHPERGVVAQYTALPY